MSPLTLEDVDVLSELAGTTDRLCEITDELSMRVFQLTSEGLPVAALTSDELAQLRATIVSALVDLTTMVADLQRVSEVVG
jgi:hypothetical protein